MRPHGIKRKSMAKYKQEEGGDTPDKPKKKVMIGRPSDTSNQKYGSSIKSSFRHSSAIESSVDPGGRGTYTETNNQNESQYTYTYTRGDQTATGHSYSKVEQEYLEFLKAYGHIDFSLIDFLPEIKSIDELKQIRRQRAKEQNSGRKYHDLLKSNKQSSKRDSQDLTVINEEEIEYTETAKSNAADDDEVR